MNGQVDSTIADLRRAVNASNDSDLARTLGIDKSTISGWRSRGSVPQKFMKFLQSSSSTAASGPIDFATLKAWPELEARSRAIGLLRFTLLRSDVARSGDVDRVMALFMDEKPFLLVWYRAAHDLAVKMQALGVEVKTAQALILQDDLREPDRTAERVARHLAEDIADNPHLKL